MITVTVQYFNILTTYTGVRKENLTLPCGTTLEGLLAALTEHHPGYLHTFIYSETGFNPYLRVFLNNRPVEVDGFATPLADGDVILMFPAVAGG